MVRVKFPMVCKPYVKILADGLPEFIERLNQRLRVFDIRFCMNHGGRVQADHNIAFLCSDTLIQRWRGSRSGMRGSGISLAASPQYPRFGRLSQPGHNQFRPKWVSFPASASLKMKVRSVSRPLLRSPGWRYVQQGSRAAGASTRPACRTPPEIPAASLGTSLRLATCESSCHLIGTNVIRWPFVFVIIAVPLGSRSCTVPACLPRPITGVALRMSLSRSVRLLIPNSGPRF